METVWSKAELKVLSIDLLICKAENLNDSLAVLVGKWEEVKGWQPCSPLQSLTRLIAHARPPRR